MALSGDKDRGLPQGPLAEGAPVKDFAEIPRWHIGDIDKLALHGSRGGAMSPQWEDCGERTTCGEQGLSALYFLLLQLLAFVARLSPTSGAVAQSRVYPPRWLIFRRSPNTVCAAGSVPTVDWD